MRRLLAFVLIINSSDALAAGFAVREQSTQAMGSAYAGAAASADDASSLAYNPAAASIAEGGDVSLDMVGIFPGSSANYPTALTAAGTSTSSSTTSNRTANGFIRNAIVPDLAIRQRLSDQWSVGLSVSVPWGLETTYPGTFAGRYYALETKLLTVNVTPVVSYDVLPNVTVAGGFQAQYAKGTLTSAIDVGTLAALAAIPGSIPGASDNIANVNAHSWAYGYVLGARAIIGDWTLGLSYRSAVHQTLKGPLTFTLDSGGLGATIRSADGLLTNTTSRTPLTTPDVVEAGVREKIDGQWTALLEVDWTNWSVFRQLQVSAANPAQPPDITNAQWNNSWLAAVGAEFAPGDDWLLRGGFAYDGSPIPTSTLDPRIPDADRYWMSVGVTYHAAAALDIDLALSHLFDSTRDVALSPTQPGNTLRGTLTGTTASDVNVLGLQAVYRWL